jgi:hypothetical protein
MKGAGVGGAIAKSSGAFFFIWTLLALFSVVLCVGGLWRQMPWRAGARQKEGASA